MDKILTFKTPQIALEWVRLDRRLMAVAYAAAGFQVQEFGIPVVITEIIRKAKHPKDVHPYGRAFDLRAGGGLEQGETTYEQAVQVAAFINVMFVYDKMRPKMKTAVFGIEVKHLDHLHIQCSGIGNNWS